MDTLIAFARGMTSRGARVMVFDWNRAAEIIAERGAKEASAGLAGDWEWTGGAIWSNGGIVEAENTYTFLASTWAEPELEVDGEAMECWRWADETDSWDSGTYWPSSARLIAARWRGEGLGKPSPQRSSSPAGALVDKSAAYALALENEPEPSDEQIAQAWQAFQERFNTEGGAA